MSDLVYINPHDAWTNWAVQQREIIQGRQGFWNNWGLQDLLGGGNNTNDNPKIFEDADYANDAATYDSAIANWISRTWTASNERAPNESDIWKTNIETLKSRGLFMWSTLRTVTSCRR